MKWQLRKKQCHTQSHLFWTVKRCLKPGKGEWCFFFFFLFFLKKKSCLNDLTIACFQNENITDSPDSPDDKWNKKYENLLETTGKQVMQNYVDSEFWSNLIYFQESNHAWVIQ